MVSTLITPILSKHKSNVTSEPANAPVCDEAEIAPLYDLPDFKIMIGFFLQASGKSLKNY